ncbi:hypothetical protein Esti_004404 [Eimeria stiedai]
MMSATSQDLDAATYSEGVIDFDAGSLSEWQAPGSLSGNFRSVDERLGKGPLEASASRASSGGLSWVPPHSGILLSVSAGSPSVHTLLATESEAIVSSADVEGLHAAQPAAPPQYHSKVTYWGVAVAAMLLVLAATATYHRRSTLSSRQEGWRAQNGRVEEGMVSETVRGQESHEVELPETASSLSLHTPRGLQVSVLNKTLAGSSFEYSWPDKGNAVGWPSAGETAAAWLSPRSLQEPVRMWADIGSGKQGSSGIAFNPLSKSEPLKTEYANDQSARRKHELWLPLVRDLDILDSQSSSPFSGSESDYTTESGSESSTPTSDANTREWFVTELRARVRLSIANSRARSSDNPRRLRSAAGKSAVPPTKKRVAASAREQQKYLFARGSRRRNVEQDDINGGSQRGLKRRPLRRLRLNAPESVYGEMMRTPSLVEGLRLVGHRKLNPGFYRVPKAPPNSPYDSESQPIHLEFGFFVNVNPTDDSASGKQSGGSVLTPDCKGSASRDAGAGADKELVFTVDIPFVAALLEREADACAPSPPFVSNSRRESAHYAQATPACMIKRVLTLGDELPTGKHAFYASRCPDEWQEEVRSNVG